MFGSKTGTLWFLMFVLAGMSHLLDIGWRDDHGKALYETDLSVDDLSFYLERGDRISTMLFAGEPMRLF